MQSPSSPHQQDSLPWHADTGYQGEQWMHKIRANFGWAGGIGSHGDGGSRGWQWYLQLVCFGDRELRVHHDSCKRRRRFPSRSPAANTTQDLEVFSRRMKGTPDSQCDPSWTRLPWLWKVPFLNRAALVPLPEKNFPFSTVLIQLLVMKASYTPSSVPPWGLMESCNVWNPNHSTASIYLSQAALLNLHKYVFCQQLVLNYYIITVLINRNALSEALHLTDETSSSLP